MIQLYIYIYIYTFHIFFHYGLSQDIGCRVHYSLSILWIMEIQLTSDSPPPSSWSWELILKMCPQWDCWQYEVWVESWGNLCIGTAIANHSGSPWLVLSMNNALDLLVGWNPFHQSCKSFILESNENDHLCRYPTYIYWICYNIASDVYVLVFWPGGMW